MSIPFVEYDEMSKSKKERKILMLPRTEIENDVKYVQKVVKYVLFSFSMATFLHY